MDDVTRKVDLDADRGEVWRAVTSADQLAEWFDAAVDGEVAQGEVLRFTSPDGTVRRALIERMDEPRALTFRWLPGGAHPPSRVEITIDEAGEGTILKVIERRVDPAVTPDQEIGFRALVSL